MTAKMIVFCGLLSTGGLFAETGRDAWLRYEALDETAARPYREALPAVLAAFGDAPEIASARQEILRGVRGMLGRTLRVEAGLPRENAIVTGTLEALRREAPALASGGDLAEDAFRLRTVASGGIRYTVIAAANPRGALYGAFTLLRKIGLHEPIANLDETQTPYAPVRWVNQWDNLDGSIERGYGGRSIFWENGAVRADLTRAGEYARLLASVGINACSVNNVNANPKALSPEILKQVARIADVFRPWGVRLALSVDFSSP
ncbi:MAG: alpha-glucuronidase family glycosyl hydrolase, partial [Bryobacteraceae bacterium]